MSKELISVFDQQFYAPIINALNVDILVAVRICFSGQAGNKTEYLLDHKDGWEKFLDLHNNKFKACVDVVMNPEIIYVGNIDKKYWDKIWDNNLLDGTGCYTTFKPYDSPNLHYIHFCENSLEDLYQHKDNFSYLLKDIKFYESEFYAFIPNKNGIIETGSY